MFLSFAYLAFSAVLKLFLGRRRSEFTKDIELIVLRHQLLVLRRQAGRPSLRPADRAFLAALARVLPQRRRHALVVTPQTLLRWHRELSRAAERCTVFGSRKVHRLAAAGESGEDLGGR